MKKIAVSISSLAAIMLLGLTLASAEPIPSGPADRVTDLAQALTGQEKTTLIAKLADIEAKFNGLQVAIFIVKSSDGQDIAQYSTETFNKWKLGQKGRDNGLLITRAVKDKKTHFTTGRGLEGDLPDAFVHDVFENTFRPLIREDKLYEALDKSIDKIIHRLEMPANSQHKDESDFPLGLIILIVVVCIILLIILIAWISSKSSGTSWGGGWGSGDGGSGGWGGGGGCSDGGGAGGGD